MENSNDPSYLKKQYEEMQMRLRITGVGGVTLADGVKTYGDIPVESHKVFEDRKKLMTYKNGIASFGVKKQNLPNMRKRDNSTPPSNVKVFALGEAKPKESKEKK